MLLYVKELTHKTVLVCDGMLSLSLLPKIKSGEYPACRDRCVRSYSRNLRTDSNPSMIGICKSVINKSKLCRASFKRSNDWLPLSAVTTLCPFLTKNLMVAVVVKK